MMGGNSLELRLGLVHDPRSTAAYDPILFLVAEKPTVAIDLLPDGVAVRLPALLPPVGALERWPRGRGDPERRRRPQRPPSGGHRVLGLELLALAEPPLHPGSVPGHQDLPLGIQRPAPPILAVHPPATLMRQSGVVRIDGPQLPRVPLHLLLALRDAPAAGGAAEEPAAALGLAPGGLAVHQHILHEVILALQRWSGRHQDPEAAGVALLSSLRVFGVERREVLPREAAPLRPRDASILRNRGRGLRLEVGACGLTTW
mmetsp:Transcript_96666/g.282556  ORF Transcript_96666/g.282556 Transcript_96666/m.282556 type:complete len:259 (+) Transcript_96666:208-984(+)